VLDVRNPGETAEGVLPGAVVVPLPSLLRRVSELDPDRPIVVYCASGYRSSIAASILRARGHHGVAELLGGYAAWRDRAPSGTSTGS
jgi:hydroxyacylglutathione hydrolase